MVSDYKFNGKHKDFINKTIKRFYLEKDCQKSIGQLSAGKQKKVVTIIAFMGFPKLIVLDEPPNAIDTIGLIVLKELILEAKEFCKCCNGKNFLFKRWEHSKNCRKRKRLGTNLSGIVSLTDLFFACTK